MPQQMQEVLDDLRLGRLSIRTVDPGLGPNADRLGRRIFSGVVAAALLIAGGLVLAAHYEIVGGVLMALAVVWLGAHLLLDTYRGFRQR